MDAPASTTELPLEGAFDQFTIGFDRRDRERVLGIWDSILRGEQWSEGEWVDRFEEAWSGWSRLPAVAFGSWAGGAMAALEFADVRDQIVLCPSNTFMATPLSVLQAGRRVEVVGCKREDLCMSFEDFERKVAQHKPRAAWLVPIGRHIAFDSERIADLGPPGGFFLIAASPPPPARSWGVPHTAANGDARP